MEFFGIIFWLAIILRFSYGSYQEKSDVTVVVVGAGAAGLSAAEKLINDGFKVTVLEAANRWGGRLYSVSDVNGGWIELGAQYVHGDHTPIYDFAKEKGFLKPLIDSHGNKYGSFFVLLNSTGGILSTQDHMRVLKAKMELTELDEDPETLQQVMFNSSLSAGEYMLQNLLKSRQKLEDPYFANLAYDMHVRHRKSDNAVKDLFAASIQSFTNSTILGPYGTELTMTYQSFLQQLSPNSIKNIHFNSRVQQISFIDNVQGDKKSLSVVLTNGTSIPADHVIFTGSLGYLKHYLPTLFPIPLSQRKQDVIRYSGFGTLGKISFVYERNWWKDFGVNFSTPYVTVLYDDEYSDPLFDKKKLYTGKPWTRATFYIELLGAPNVLTAFFGGPQAEDVELLTDQQLSADTTQYFRTCFQNNEIPEPAKVYRNKWHSEDLFRGTYSHITMEMNQRGLSIEDHYEPEYLYNITFKHQSRIVPGLLFAGEATHPKYFSMAHGAILSGWREADRLISLYATNTNAANKNHAGILFVIFSFAFFMTNC